MGKNEIIPAAQDKPVKGYANWQDGLDRTEKGKVIQSISNGLYALNYNPELSGILKYNEFSGKTEVHGTTWKRYTPAISDLDIDFIKLKLEKDGLTSERAILSAVNITAHNNSYHPVQDVLNGLEWDGKDHLSELFPKYLGANREPYTTLITKVLFGGLIGRTFTPGIKFDTAVVLQDVSQGGGKSTMARFLAIKDEWYTSLKSVDDPDKVVEQITGHLVVELEEMESIASAKSIETVRSFLSRSTDSYRTPYAKFSQDIRRGSICIGTSNDPAFLPMDRAGNRRFLPLRCDKIAAVQHPLDNEAETRKDIMQCYAQAMVLYRKGNLPVKLPKDWEKKLPEIQRDFLPEDTKAGIIEQFVMDSKKDITIDGFCVQMIYKEALRNAGTPKQWESKEIAAILDGLTDENGNKILKRYDKSGQIKRFNHKEHLYGRQKAWVFCSPGEQFLTIPDVEGESIPFDD